MAARFYSGGAQGRVALTGSFQDVITGQTNGSDVRRIIFNNQGSSDRLVVIADENDNEIDIILVPASAGKSGTIGATSPAIDALNGSVPIGGTEMDAYGNRFYRLYSASKLRMKQTAGTDVSVQWSRSDYEA